MTIEQDYLNQMDELDKQISELRQKRQRLFLDYIHCIARSKDPQTDLCDYIRDKELKNK